MFLFLIRPISTIMVQETIEIMLATIIEILSKISTSMKQIKNCPALSRPDSGKSVNSIKYYKGGKARCQAENELPPLLKGGGPLP